jgi:hypothetical protein
MRFDLSFYKFLESAVNLPLLKLTGARLRELFSVFPKTGARLRELFKKIIKQEKIIYLWKS